MTQSADRCIFFFFQAEDGIRFLTVTGVQTCALPICAASGSCTGQAALPEVDSPLIVAQPVQYTPRMPRREFASILDFQKSLTETVEQIGRASCRERV